MLSMISLLNKYDSYRSLSFPLFWQYFSEQILPLECKDSPSEPLFFFSIPGPCSLVEPFTHISAPT